MMFARRIFVIFATLVVLLLQGCRGEQHSETDPKRPDSTEQDRGVNPKAATLALSVFEELSAFVDWTIDGGEKLLNDVVADVAATAAKDNELLSRRIKKITDVVEKIEKLKKLPSDEADKVKWNVASEMFGLLGQFNVTAKEHPTPEDEIFAEYFEKHGLETYRRNGRKKMIEGINVLGQKFDNFWNELSVEEKDTFPLFRAWLLKFQEESLYEKKLDLIVAFFIRHEEPAD